MTTFQDPPPHSRRAVRQSERGENPDAQVNFAQFTGDQPVAPAENPSAASAEERAAAAEQEPFAGPAPTGRRARAAAPDTEPEPSSTPPQAEPLNYVTQGGASSTTSADPWAQPSTHAQQPEQAYRVRDFSPEGRRSAAPQQPQPWANASDSRGGDVAAPLEYRTQAAPVRPTDQPADAQVTTPPVQVTTPPAQVTTPPAQVTTPPAAFLPPSAQAPQPTVHAVPVSATPEPITMSRRELRALLAQQEAAAAQASGPVPPLVEPAAAASASALSNAMAEFEALTRARQAVPVPEQAPVHDRSAEQSTPEAELTTPPAELTTPPAQLTTPPAELTTPPDESPTDTNAEAAFAAAAAMRAAQDERAREEAAEREAQSEAREQSEARQQSEARERAEHETQAEAVRQAELRAEEERQEQARRAAAIDTARAEALHAEAERQAASQPPSAPEFVSEQPVQLTPQFVEPAVAEQPFSSTAGHWSRQGELDDETQPHENTLSRQVGGSNVATTTSALVLPVIPAPDFSTAIGSTGDILVTGSIDLPRSLGATGGDARRYDDPDVDNLFDAFDNEIISTDSAPVRAIRAVSTHTSTHGVLANAQPKTSRMLPILLATTVVLAVAVVTLLAVAFANGMF